MKIGYALFAVGIGVGIFCVKGYEKFIPMNFTPIEVALGEVLYEKVSCFPKQEYDIAKVSTVLNELSEKKRERLLQEDRDTILMELLAKEAEKASSENLMLAERYLANICKQKTIQEVVPNKVFIEVLEEGVGAFIKADDAISVYFKQYDLDGSIIKDTTEEKAFAIPLKQMIKGFSLALDGAREGEKRKLYIHPDYGFGKISSGLGKSCNQLLIYEVKIVEKL